MPGNRATEEKSATAADHGFEAHFSEALLKTLYAENADKPRMGQGESRRFKLECVRDYRDLGFTLSQLEEEQRQAQEAENYFESVGQRLLAQRAKLRAAAAKSLIASVKMGGEHAPNVH